MGQFTAASRRRHSLSRSYGAILPSSLTRFHSCALVYSTHPPVSVYGTGRLNRKWLFLAVAPVIRIGRSRISEFNNLVTFQTASPQVKGRRCRNIDLLSIAYAYRPRLRSRLTPGRKTLPGKPRVYGGRGSHPAYRYSCLHTLFSTLHRQSPSGFNALRTLLYRACAPRASAYRLSPIIFGAGSLDE